MIHTSASSAEIKALFLLHLVKKKKSHFQAKQVRKIEVATQSSETEKKFMFGISLLPQVEIKLVPEKVSALDQLLTRAFKIT